MRDLTASDEWQFLSTPSARRATKLTGAHPCGHRISIHALREEGDADRTGGVALEGVFLSTPSARRATDQWYSALQIKEISIHALREEGDRPHPRP